MYEKFMTDNVTPIIEQNILPQWWSANTVTVIGNIPLFIAGGTALYYGGPRFHEVEGEPKLDPLPPWVIFFGAFAVQWFSFFDMMDGQRARRLKCGSPIGRIVDQAGDLMMYTWFSFFLGYWFKVPPGWLCLSYAVINLPAYTIEISMICTGVI